MFETVILGLTVTQKSESEYLSKRI